jgi:NAD+ synthase (glutamine-hydrolysing)
LERANLTPLTSASLAPLVDEIMENRRSKQELIEKGYPEEVVKAIYKQIRRAEYKRRQATPCIKITRKAFGIGWKMPIVNKYSSEARAV